MKIIKFLALYYFSFFLFPLMTIPVGAINTPPSMPNPSPTERHEQPQAPRLVSRSAVPPASMARIPYIPSVPTAAENSNHPLLGRNIYNSSTPSPFASSSGGLRIARRLGQPTLPTSPETRTVPPSSPISPVSLINPPSRSSIVTWSVPVVQNLEVLGSLMAPGTHDRRPTPNADLLDPALVAELSLLIQTIKDSNIIVFRSCE